MTKLIKDGSITNPNPVSYSTTSGLKLKNISVPGYTFEGWYDAPGASGEIVKEIVAGTTGEVELYAKWTKVVYTITFDSPEVPWASVTYTVDTGTTLTNPSWFGYTFVGWSEDGKIVKDIPVGTIGNKTLHANWTSDRNKAVSKTLTEPLSQPKRHFTVTGTSTAFVTAFTTDTPLSSMSAVILLNASATFATSKRR